MFNTPDTPIVQQSPAPIAWVVPGVTDVWAVLDQEVGWKANANIGPGVQPNDEYNPGNPDRVKALLSNAVAEMVGAIRNARRIPVSLTAGAVPPECVIHVLYRTAYELVSSVPNNQMTVMTELGAPPLVTNNKTALEFIAAVRRGQLVSYPTDPQTFTDAFGAVRDAVEVGGGGDICGEVDMSLHP